MNSLAPECTPLRHRYDSCFNKWFEGYLEIASMAQQNAKQTNFPGSPNSQFESSSALSSSGTTTRPRDSDSSTNSSWSSLFSSMGSPEEEARRAAEAKAELDKRMKVKREEYERDCGKAWREYEGCLKRAISSHPELPSLLESSRNDDPLESLKGVNWPVGGQGKETKDQKK